MYTYCIACLKKYYSISCVYAKLGWLDNVSDLILWTNTYHKLNITGQWQKMLDLALIRIRIHKPVSHQYGTIAGKFVITRCYLYWIFFFITVIVLNITVLKKRRISELFLPIDSSLFPSSKWQKQISGFFFLGKYGTVHFTSCRELSSKGKNWLSWWPIYCFQGRISRLDWGKRRKSCVESCPS